MTEEKTYVPQEIPMPAMFVASKKRISISSKVPTGGWKAR
jgi:hypothetical protein